MSPRTCSILNVYKQEANLSHRDDHDLSRFGYAQELFRSIGGFSNFAISFSIISILTGAATLYGYGLGMGGPLEMSLGWPVATLFTLALAASMAELCSAYPTSGAMYHWATVLGGAGWGWFVAWLNIIGCIAAQAGINYSCAQFILPLFGATASPQNVYAVFAFTLVVHGILNHTGVRLVAILNDVSVAVHIIGVFIVAGAVFFFAPTQPVSFLTHAVNSNGRSPYLWCFFLGLLQAHWTYTGFDASAHMSEETSNPRVKAPWGIFLSVAVSGVVGYILLIALTLAISNLPAVLNAKDASGNEIPAAIAVMQQGLGARMGNTMAALASMAMWFCGLSCLTSASRAVYSLARDNGMPFSSLFKQVNKKHGTPGPAIWALVAATAAAMAWTGAIPVVTSLSTAAFYLSYVIPVIFGLRARINGSTWPQLAEWKLGKYGVLINWIAAIYTCFITIVLIMPPNELAAKTLGSLVAMLILIYSFDVKNKFAGPAWANFGESKGPS